MSEYLERLSNAFGVSGVESDVRKIIIEAIEPLADKWWVDTMGNLFVLRERAGDGAAPLRVMATAHMDEVGFIISDIKKDGRLKFRSIGTFDPRVLLGKALVVGQERLPGVVGLKPVHLLGAGERERVGSIDSMYIDIGAADDQAGGKVKPGDFATFATRFRRLGGPPPAQDDQGLVSGKAFDDRAGCAVLLELLKERYPVDLMAVFTVQEEVGLRGASVAAYTAEPDLAFILECTAADDLPHPDDEDKDEDFPRLGAGPAITVMDRSFIADRRLVDLLIETAQSEKLPYQFKRPGIGGTDAGAIHLARKGIPSVAVSMAARYIHAPAAVLDLADFWNTVKLMQATLKRLPEQDW